LRRSKLTQLPAVAVSEVSRDVAAVAVACSCKFRKVQKLLSSELVNN